MAAIFQTRFSNVSYMFKHCQMYKFWLRFHWSLFIKWLSRRLGDEPLPEPTRATRIPAFWEYPQTTPWYPILSTHIGSLSFQVKLDMSTARRRLKSPQSLYGTSAHHTMVTQRSQSWSWMIDSHPFHSMSISPPIAQIRLFQTLTLKLQGQGHGSGQRSRSNSSPSIQHPMIPHTINSYRIPFIPSQTRYVDGTPTSEVTPVTIWYIRPPHHGYP